MNHVPTTTTELTIGQRVWYRGRFGNASPVPAVVTGFGHKEGLPVVDVQIVGATDPLKRDRWGYLDQLEVGLTPLDYELSHGYTWGEELRNKNR